MIVQFHNALYIKEHPKNADESIVVFKDGRELWVGLSIEQIQEQMYGK